MSHQRVLNVTLTLSVSADTDWIGQSQRTVDLLSTITTTSAMAERVNSNMLFANFNQDFT